MEKQERHITGTMGMVDNRFSNKYESVNAIYQEIRALEPIITADMQNLANTIGTSFIGTEYSIKTASSIEDKLKRAEQVFERNKNILDNGFTPKQQLKHFKDIIRYTEICQHSDIMKTAKQTIEHLESQGYVLSGIRNYYINPYPDTGYRGLHLNFITPYGQEMELQVHSQESFDAKQTGHSLYEQIRSISTLEADKEQLKNEIKLVHGTISKPKGYSELPYKYDLPNKEQIINKLQNNIDIYIEEAEPTDRPFIKIYSIYKNDEQLLTGFECMFSDNSVRVYQNNVRDGIAKYGAVNKHGSEIITHDAPQRELSREDIVKLAFNAERNHAQWMERNFANKEREDADMQKQQIEQIAAMDFNVIELS